MKSFRVRLARYHLAYLLASPTLKDARHCDNPKIARNPYRGHAPLAVTKDRRHLRWIFIR